MGRIQLALLLCMSTIVAQAMQDDVRGSFDHLVEGLFKDEQGSSEERLQQSFVAQETEAVSSMNSAISQKKCKTPPIPGTKTCPKPPKYRVCKYVESTNCCWCYLPFKP